MKQHETMKTHEPVFFNLRLSMEVLSPNFITRKEFQVSNECATEPMWGPRYQENHQASQQQQKQQQQHGAKVNPRLADLEH